MRGRALAVALATVAAVPSGAALAAFGASVTASSDFATYTVSPPASLRCTGLLQLSTSRITWDAVAPPAGQTVDYLVTPPSGRATSTGGAAFWQLPAVTLLPGRYAVQTAISSGWQSQPATITVTLGALGLLYLCSAP